MQCRFHSCTETDESKLELHHIIPKCFFPTDAVEQKKYDLIKINGVEEANRIYLCKKHHDIIQGFILNYLFWNHIIDKESVKIEIFELTKKHWCKK